MSNTKHAVTLVCNETALENVELNASLARLQRTGHRTQTFPISQLDQAVESDCSILVAAGGDGTINAVASALLARDESKKPLGVVPLGTGNDFAAGAGIPVDDPDEAMRIVITGDAKRIDVGKMNDRYFVNVVSGGFGAEATAETSEELKAVLGKLAYTVAGLGKIFRPNERKASIRARDLEWEGELLLLSVANGRFAGGGYPMARDAVLNDGMFDVLVVPDAGILAAPTVLVELLDAGTVDSEHVHFVQSPWVEVETAKGIQLSIDGEPYEAKSVRMEIVPGALSFVLPEVAPLQLDV